MINLFLNAKHWQIFLLTFGIPMIMQFMMMGSMMHHFTLGSDPDVSAMMDNMKYFSIAMIFSGSVYFMWMWSVAIGLQHKVPDHVILHVRRFKVLFIIPLLYIIFMILLVTGIGFERYLSVINTDIIAGVFAIIVVLHLSSMFCMFYSLYFIAKTLKSIETRRTAKFSDFAGEFFMLWFFPIGIWILQPRINNMILEKQPFE